MTRCFTSYYLYIDSPLSVSKVWKNESKVILSLKFQNLSLIGNLKKKNLSFYFKYLSIFLLGCSWMRRSGEGDSCHSLRVNFVLSFFACVIFVSMQRSSFSPPALFLLQKLQLFLYLLPMFLSSSIFWSTLFFLQMDSSWSISSLFSPVLFVSRCGFWSVRIPVIEES